MKKVIRILSVCILFWGCASSKPNTSADDLKIVEDLVTNKFFTINSDWAQPQGSSALNSLSNARLLPAGSSGSMISLTGNPNYVTIKGDSITGYLPYFGQRQMGGSYGSANTAIQFDGVPKDYEVKNGNKDTYILSFNIADKTNKTEKYSVTIKLFPNLTSDININSSHRTSISYRGVASTIDKK